MDALEALKTRRSRRAYRPDPVPRDLLEQMVDCGRLAASAMNVQPWAFVVVTDEGMHRKLAYTTEYGKFIAQYGACIVVFCEEGTYYLEDGSAAIQNILVAGQALGIGTCWVAGDKKPYADTIRQMLGLPEKYRLIGLIAAGYATDSSTPNKKTLGEVIHWERYTP